MQPGQIRLGPIKSHRRASGSTIHLHRSHPRFAAENFFNLLHTMVASHPFDPDVPRFQRHPGLRVILINHANKLAQPEVKSQSGKAPDVLSLKAAASQSLCGAYREALLRNSGRRACKFLPGHWVFAKSMCPIISVGEA